MAGKGSEEGRAVQWSHSVPLPLPLQLPLFAAAVCCEFLRFQGFSRQNQKCIAGAAPLHLSQTRECCCFNGWPMEYEPMKTLHPCKSIASIGRHFPPFTLMTLWWFPANPQAYRSRSLLALVRLSPHQEMTCHNAHHISLTCVYIGFHFRVQIFDPPSLSKLPALHPPELSPLNAAALATPARSLYHFTFVNRIDLFLPLSCPSHPLHPVKASAAAAPQQREGRQCQATAGGQEEGRETAFSQRTFGSPTSSLQCCTYIYT